MTLYNSKNSFVKKAAVTSGASRIKSVVNFKLLLPSPVKKLTFRLKWSSGTSRFGRRVSLSKGKKNLTTRARLCNYSPSDNSLSFNYGHSFTRLTTKLYSLVFSASGRLCYERNYINATPFTILSHNLTQLSFRSKYQLANDIVKNQVFLVRKLALLKTSLSRGIVSIQIKPGKPTKFVRSEGSSASVLKKNYRVLSAVVKLPSGVKKVFSLLSTCCNAPKKDNVRWPELFNVSSKTLGVRGKAARSRGVAKNPIDHPHGGRTKSIKYPRTPWGKTTKFK
jgi:ribosomal protein L2